MRQPMVDTIALSLPAVDVLGEQLNLDVRQYPFELSRPEESADERARLVRQVWGELEAAGLAADGRPEPEVEDALYLLCGSEVSIAAAGLLDVRTGQRLAARVVATGEVGVVGVLDGRGLRLDFLDPHDLPEVCADLLPQAPTPPGEPVRAERAAHSRALEEITSRHRYRIGHFQVSGGERRGGDPAGLAWFDNDLGRFTLLGETTPDGRDVLTCAPADRAAVAERLSEQLSRLARA
ncbi:ESX secretion-associated protein EspG [Saccharopolyspora sp. 6M]|uniref:ESX secretion-associated protein EspG n=1 Tax=Saccharopolyspora sp. 6M TaxID=2877237 RepID=UPI001CD47BEF|nr:ESX secretion-associated protein EspG [Saccharopolyspora sp. 6M]MCA1228514.1 ESX secretion-associated protein EspG [Saccharopolyspora sp. 6M]